MVNVQVEMAKCVKKKNGEIHLTFEQKKNGKTENWG